MFCTTVVNIFVSVFLILLARSSFGIERTERLLIDNDPNSLQVQVDHLMQELNALKSDANREISYLKSQLATQGLAISTCRGIAAGGQYSESGNGANTLCLPHDPERFPFGITLASGDDYAHLYGAEYRLDMGRVHSPEDVPCALCRTKITSSTIMFPGKRTCPNHWQKQYTGILTASRHAYQISEYLCLNDDPDYVEGSRNRDNGRLFYPVKTVCGSLPCPPYEHGQLVSCVVCSR